MDPFKSKHLHTYILTLPFVSDDDDDELFCGMVDRQKALFPAGTIVRSPHHRESPTRREQGLNLRRT